jgi:two-component system response regulator
MSRTIDNTTASPDVLLVEDHRADAALVEELLSDDYDLEILTDGGTAISTLRSLDSGAAAPEVIVLDLDLPQWNGLDVLAAVRGEPTLELVPVVMLSDSTSDDDRGRARDLGADRFVTKPMDIDDFGREIEAIERAYLRGR